MYAGQLLGTVISAGRRSLKDRAFIAGLVASYAIGLWVSLTVLAHADRFLLRAPDGITNPDELRRLLVHRRPSGQDFALAPVISLAAFHSLQNALGEAAVTVYAPVTVQISTAAGAESIRAAVISGGFFEVLGVPLAIGRGIATDDDREGGATSAVASDALMRRLGGQSDNPLATVLRVNGNPVRVVGIAPSQFTAIDADNVDLWIPLGTAPVSTASKSTSTAYLSPIVRLQKGQSPVQIKETVRRVVAAYDRRAEDVTLVRVAHSRFGGSPGTQRAIAFAFGFAGCVILLSIANCLFLSFGSVESRWPEWTVRRALGASRTLLFVELMTRVAVPLTIGMTLSLLTLDATKDIFVASGVGDAPALLRPMITASALAFTLTVSAVIAGVALTGSAVARKSLIVPSRSRSTFAARASITTYIGGVAVVLVVAVPVWIAFHVSSAVDSGYGNNALVVTVSDQDSGSGDPRIRAARVRYQLTAMPFIADVGVSTTFPYKSYMSLQVPEMLGGGPVGVFYVAGNFLGALGIPTLLGDPAPFAEAERQSRAVVNEAFLHVDPSILVGGCVHLPGGCAAVDAVVGNADAIALGEPDRPLLFLPLSMAEDFSTVYFSARTVGPITPSIKRDVVTSVSTVYARSVIGVESLRDLMAEQTAFLRAITGLMTLFVVFGLGLTLLGLRACVAYAFRSRRHELAVRAVLGATPIQLLVLASKQLAMAAVAGLVAGLLLGLVATQLLAATFDGLPRSAPIQMVMGIVLPIATIAAAIFWAWNRTRLDLRSELREL